MIVGLNERQLALLLAALDFACMLGVSGTAGTGKIDRTEWLELREMLRKRVPEGGS